MLLQGLSNQSRRQLGDLDPHTVGGVLLSCLKEMSPSILYEIIDDLLKTGIQFL